jgi:sodium transport system ATP-binding protein
VIEVQAIRKAFGKVEAVQDVSFRAKDGQVTGLLGPNGAGKSTTLRMLSTILKPDGGDARIDNVSVTSDPQAVKRSIGTLPHDSGLYRNLTARENIEYFGRLYGLEGSDLMTRTEAVIEALDIGEFANRKTEGFSQGQRTKVALARSLIHSPRNLLLDEPTNGLDVMSTRALRELIRGLRADGKCILFSSHIMQEVASLCDVIVIIAHGRVTAAGTPDQILATTGAADLEEAFVRSIINDA